MQVLAQGRMDFYRPVALDRRVSTTYCILTFTIILSIASQASLGEVML